MRVLTLAVGLIAAGPALAGTGWFAEGNPWFRDYEKACRVDNTVAEKCRGSILGAVQEKAKGAKVTCDWRAFWRVKDAMQDSKILPVLPWQYGVLLVLDQGGVCTVSGAPQKAETSPSAPADCSLQATAEGYRASPEAKGADNVTKDYNAGKIGYPAFYEAVIGSRAAYQRRIGCGDQRAAIDRDMSRLKGFVQGKRAWPAGMGMDEEEYVAPPPSPEIALVNSLKGADSRALDFVVAAKLGECGSTCTKIDPPTPREIFASAAREYGTLTVFDCAKTIPDVLGKIGNRFAAGLGVDRELLGPYQFCVTRFFPMGSKDECTATIKTFRELRKANPALGKSAFRTVINETCGPFFEKTEAPSAPTPTPAVAAPQAAAGVKTCYPGRIARMNSGQLEVRTAPNTAAWVVDQIDNERPVYVCGMQAGYTRVIYSNFYSVDGYCAAAQQPYESPYSGPCSIGWVDDKYVDHARN